MEVMRETGVKSISFPGRRHPALPLACGRSQFPHPQGGDDSGTHSEWSEECVELCVVASTCCYYGYITEVSLAVVIISTWGGVMSPGHQIVMTFCSSPTNGWSDHVHQAGPVTWSPCPLPQRREVWLYYVPVF